MLIPTFDLESVQDSEEFEAQEDVNKLLREIHEEKSPLEIRMDRAIRMAVQEIQDDVDEEIFRYLDLLSASSK
jgi:hypothetical protein